MGGTILDFMGGDTTIMGGNRAYGGVPQSCQPSLFDRENPCFGGSLPVSLLQEKSPFLKITGFLQKFHNFPDACHCVPC